MPDSSYSVESALGPNTPGLPTSMLAQPFTFTANYTATTTGDDAGTKNFNFNGLTARVFLAGAATGSGVDETDPLELLAVVEANLGASWTVRMGIDGRVRITYVGSLVGEITWGTSIVIARLLGFTASTLSGLEGVPVAAPYPPMGVVYCKAREKATDWTMRAAGLSGALAGNGVVTGRTDGRRILTQTFTSRVHPRTWAEASDPQTLSYATPLYAQDSTPARRFQPAGPLGVLPPWSVDEFVTTALGHRCAFALGTFQALVAGTRTDFEVGYLLPEMIRDLKSPKSAGNWRVFRDVDFALSAVKGLNPDGTETR